MDFKVNLKSNEDRPVMLLVICILSWVNIGFSFIISLFRLITGPATKEQIRANQADLKGAAVELRNGGQESFADIFDKIQNMQEILNDQHYVALSLTLLGLLIGFAGVSLMFLGRKLGFHIYIIYSIFTIGQIYLFFSASEIPSTLTWFGIIFSALFIALYARNLKWMN